MIKNHFKIILMINLIYISIPIPPIKYIYFLTFCIYFTYLKTLTKLNLTALVFQTKCILKIIFRHIAIAIVLI
jgi:hypothetical protein